MATAWRQVAGEASDSDEEVVFTGPVTERELEISRLLNETVCLPNPDESDSASDTLAGLESGLRAVALEGTRESCTMHELELPTIGRGTRSYPVTSTHLEESAAPLASGESTRSSRQWEELPSDLPLSSTRLTEESRVWEELPSENPVPDDAVPKTEESRVWEELPSENPLPDHPATSVEKSRVWEEMPSENPLPEHAAAPVEESRVWEEMPSENPLPEPPAAPVEESRVWEEMPSENPVREQPAALTEESRVWEELPSEFPLSAPPPAEESQQWEELPSEYPLSAPPPAEESQQWEELPSEYPLSAPPAVQESLCENLSEEKEPTNDSRWLSLASDEEDIGPGDSLDERREAPGALLDALCDELAEEASPCTPAVRVSPHVLVTNASPRVPVSPRSPSAGSGGLLQVMHRQLSSPGGASVAASVESYHTCYGGGAADDSRRLTGASVFSDISLTPAAPPNSTIGVEAAEDSSDDDSRLYESSVEEQLEPQRLADVPRSSESAVMDETTSDNRSPSPSLAGRDRITSLASESSLAGSVMSCTSTGSELNDTLEMMEKLLAMEAEERRLESILQSRTAGGETVLQASHAGASEGGDGLGDTQALSEDSAVIEASLTDVATPVRPLPPGTAGRKPTPVPAATPTPRGRGRPAALTPRLQQLSAKSPARLATPRGKAAPSPARSVVSRLRTPTPVSKIPTVALQPATPRTKPNLKDIVSPVARYIHDGPEPTLVQNLRPRNRLVNSVVPQARPTPQKLAPLAEEAPASSSDPSQETGKVLKELNTSAGSIASNTSNVSATSSASAGSRIPVKVFRASGGQENRVPQASLPKVSYKTSGNLVMDKTAWNKLVRKNTAENRKVGRFVPSPSPVLTVKHTGHKSVSSRRVRWNDEFSVPDMTVRVRPMRRSISDCDLTQGSEGSFMEVSVCEVRSARPAGLRH